MKVVFVIPKQSGGGAEKVINLIAASLPIIDARCHVKIVTLLADAPTTFGGSLTPTVSLNASRVGKSLPALYRYLKNERPDVVISTLKHVSIMCSVVCFALKLRHIIRVANNYSMELQNVGAAKRLVYRHILKLSSRLSKEFICVSRGVELDLIKNFGVKQNKTRVIYNPVDPQKPAPHDIDRYAQIYLSPKGAKIFLFVGRLTKQKNLPFLFECMKTASSTYILWIVGGGPEEAALKELVKKSNLDDRILFYGHKNDTAEFYRNADCFVLTSNYEGFPNVLLEAMSYGLPLISINCPSGPSEIITSLQIGHLISSNDSAGFIAAMENVDKSKGFEVRKEIVCEQHNINKISREYYDAICT
ncbi:MAG: glycosyltransferase [Rhodobacteraceae bacterium]|nr:glycosyltransferase [Paracoccaceae bacterium]